ncbi:MAG: murein biosynthesis integral membrane protein MurJ, partial [Rhodospirillales bacterium]|nr:murein biosynthesis integral membrane protein MurJ [Rhodospirillales bacterium]
MSLAKSILTVGGFTILSRITGFARDMMVANYLGAGLVADAFFVAFKFPNLFRRLFAEGAFNAAFVPMYAGIHETEGESAAHRFAERALAVLAWWLFLFVAGMEVVMPWAMHLFAPGFESTPGKMELATDLSRITFPYLLFISLVSLQSGVLNSIGRFAAAAGTPVLLNLILMAALVGLMPVTPTAGHALAWGTTAAGIAQFLWLVFSVRNAGVRLGMTWPRLDPQILLLMKRIVPGAVGAGIYQVNLLVDTMIASMVSDGAVSVLYYADRVNQLPLGVVGIAIGTALLPVLARQLRAGDHEAATHSQNRSIEFALLLTLPATAALLTISHPLVKTLFEHGKFGASETLMTAQALQAFAMGLPAFVLVKALTPGFFAREDTSTPVKVACAAMLANIVFNIALMKPLAHVGVALSTSLSAWANVAALAIIL